MTDREKFEKFATDNCLPIEKSPNGSYEIASTLGAWQVWQAALSARKPFCLGVIKANRDPYKTFHPSEEEQANKFVKFLNDEDIVGSPYRVVTLFYEDQ